MANKCGYDVLLGVTGFFVWIVQKDINDAWRTKPLGTLKQLQDPPKFSQIRRRSCFCFPWGTNCFKTGITFAQVVSERFRFIHLIERGRFEKNNNNEGVLIHCFRPSIILLHFVDSTFVFKRSSEKKMVGWAKTETVPDPPNVALNLPKMFHLHFVSS